MLIVTTPFVGHGYNMPSAGTLIDPQEPARSDLLQSGCVAEFEVKVLPIPPEVKKNEQSESLPADPVVTPKTRKRSVRKLKPSQ
jgi:hypothetical protein